MSVQTTYGNATGKGVPGGIYDMYHYPVDSRFNEEDSGVLRFGCGVVRGTIPGSNVAMPTADSTADTFEGVVINGFNQQHDLEGRVTLLHSQNIGVMRAGRVWVRLEEGCEPAYGDELFLVTSGDDVGCFSTENGIKLNGRFIGCASRGVAPVELFGTAIPTAIPAAAEEVPAGEQNQ